MIQFSKHNEVMPMLRQHKANNAPSILTERAMKAISETNNATDFGNHIQMLMKEDLHQLASALPQHKRSNPKLYYKLVSAFTKAKSNS